LAASGFFAAVEIFARYKFGVLKRMRQNEEPRRKQRGIFVGVEIYFTGGGHTSFVLLHNSYSQKKFNRRLLPRGRPANQSVDIRSFFSIH
jgi:hypothetical protein